jgi:hypothetical protein
MARNKNTHNARVKKALSGLIMFDEGEAALQILHRCQSLSYKTLLGMGQWALPFPTTAYGKAVGGATYDALLTHYDGLTLELVESMMKAKHPTYVAAILVNRRKTESGRRPLKRRVLRKRATRICGDFERFIQENQDRFVDVDRDKRSSRGMWAFRHDYCCGFAPC